MKSFFKIAAAFFATIFISTALSFAQTTAPTASLAKPVLTANDHREITISEASPDAVVLYTLDGGNPDLHSGDYLAPIDLSHGGTLKARAFSKDRKQSSDVVTAVYQPLPGLSPLPSTLIPVTQNRTWPGYVWTARHAAECELVRNSNPQILFIGDSITHFFGGNPKSYRSTGQAVWQKYFGGLSPANLGFGWDRTENVLWRLNHGELDGCHPKVAVIMIGTNDLSTNKPSEIASGITAICQTIHAKLPTTHILLLGIFPRGATAANNPYREKIAAVNAEISALNGKDGVTYLDIGKQFLNADGSISRDIMGDYLHPTPKGYEIWAKAIQPEVQKLMAN